MNIKRRLGKGGTDSKLTSGAKKCPDLFELDSGDFLVIGTDVTHEFDNALPPTGLVSEGERIVRIPRELLVGAKSEIPDV